MGKEPTFVWWEYPNERVPGGVFGWIRRVEVRRGGQLDARKPPIHLIPVCAISDIRTGPDKFDGHR